MRMIFSFIAAFAVSLIAGRLLIPVLRALGAGQGIKEYGPAWHKIKQATPTMGGLTFILGTAAAIGAAGWRDLADGDLGAAFVFLFALVFGAIGFADDYVKVRHHHGDGLSAGGKFLLQLAAAIAFILLLRLEGYLKFDFYIPFLNVTLTGVPEWLYMLFAAFVMVGTVNSVNLTDGIDGLATGVTMPVMLFFTAVAALWGRGELAVFSAGLFGGLCAFLFYNFHPAKVFMGDTGSLFLGGAVCGMAFALDMPLVLLVVGVIYVAETVSDILQVAYFKLTHGKRLFRMAPLHHHLELGGWSEVKLFAVFSGITLGMCVLAWFGVAGRYPG